MKKRSFRPLVFLVCVAVPLGLGIVAGLLTSARNDIYGTISTPSFAPPAILFPIVWGILYTLMGVSLYLVYDNGGSVRSYALFAVQLAVNLIWPFIFFNAQAFTFAFIWLLLLWVLILLMILSFRKISPAAAYLQIPYLLWVTFAGILNLSIAVMN